MPRIRNHSYYYAMLCTWETFDETPSKNPTNAADAYKLIMTFPITKRLTELRFSYYDGQDDEWRDDWPKTLTRRPKIIQFTLKLLSPLGKIHTYQTAVPFSSE